MSPQNTHSPADEYDRVTRRAGWLDRRARGRLRFDGRDAATFLHALVSHDIESLRAGDGRYATYLTPQGRMIADLRVHHLGDHLIADVAAGKGAPLALRFDQLIFAEDVQVTDVSSSVAQIAVLGSAAVGMLARAFDIDETAVAELALLANIAARETLIVRTDDTMLPSYDVFMPAAFYDDAVARLSDAGAIAISPDTFDALRIEAGRPAFGVDMTEETIPLEAGIQDRAISMTKGCYVGQEVIVRVLHRGGGRVAKRLVVLAFDAAISTAPAPGAPIVVEGKEVGKITSAAWSSGRRAAIALGYVPRDVAEVGRHVNVGGDSAVITSLAG